MLETIFYICVALGIIAFAIMILAYKYRHLQDELLYYPDMPPGSAQHCDHPGEYGIERYERLSIVTPDGITLRGFIMKPSTTADPTCCIVYFHGNAGNVGQRLPIAKMFINKLRAAVIMVDYRGYGLSDKVPPNEEGLEVDCQAVLDWAVVHSKVPCDRIFLMGTSLGGAAVGYLASKERNNRKYAGVIIENSFTSISDMGDVLIGPILTQKLPRASKCLIPFLKHVVKPIVLFIGWDNLNRVRSIELPALFLSSAQDELVLASQYKVFYDNCKSHVKQFVSFPTGKHNDLWQKEGYCDAIGAFIRTAVSSQSQSSTVDVV